MKRRALILGILMLISVTITLGRAQDVSWVNAESDWTSPSFVPSRNTRLEWKAYPHADTPNPSFRINILEVGVGVIDQRSTLEGIGNLDNFGGRTIQLNIITAGIRIWEIHLFNLQELPITTTTPGPVTTTSPSENSTTSTTPSTITIAETTITQTISISHEVPVTTTIPITTYTRSVAVYTQLPKGSTLISFSFTFIVIGFLAAFFLVNIFMFTKYVLISFIRKEELDDSISVTETEEQS